MKAVLLTREYQSTNPFSFWRGTKLEVRIKGQIVRQYYSSKGLPGLRQMLKQEHLKLSNLGYDVLTMQSPVPEIKNKS